MFLLTDYFFFLHSFFFSPVLTLLLFLFPVVVWSLGFFFVLLSISLPLFFSISSLPGLGLRLVCFQPDLLWVARSMLKGKQVADWIWRRLLGDSPVTYLCPDGKIWLIVPGTWRLLWANLFGERHVVPMQQEGWAVLLIRMKSCFCPVCSETLPATWPVPFFSLCCYNQYKAEWYPATSFAAY